MHSMNWDDLKIVLAVSSHGSASAAARSLGVNHATIVRRIKAFETAHNVRLFDHLSSGYRLTSDGKLFVDAATVMDSAVVDLQRKVIGAKGGFEGRVRLTTTDGLFPLMADDLQRLHRLYPDIELDLAITNQQVSLNDLDADLAIRTSQQAPDNLVSEHLSSVSFAVYANSPELQLDSTQAIANQRWIGLSPPMSNSAPGQWLESKVPEKAIVMRCNSFLHVRSLVEHGLGLGLLPCFLGDTEASLHRVRGQPLPFTNQIWLVSHADVLRSPRVQVCFDYFLESMRRKQALLAGDDSV